MEGQTLSVRLSSAPPTPTARRRTLWCHRARPGEFWSWLLSPGTFLVLWSTPGWLLLLAKQSRRHCHSSRPKIGFWVTNSRPPPSQPLRHPRRCLEQQQVPWEKTGLVRAWFKKNCQHALKTTPVSAVIKLACFFLIISSDSCHKCNTNPKNLIFH